MLREYLDDGMRVLEIGTGTGQHAVHFGHALPGVRWLTSDLSANHAGIVAWLEPAALANVANPIELDTRSEHWPLAHAVDAVFSANTAHIMHWDAVCGLFRGTGRWLRDRGHLIVYGPFRFDGQHVSESNVRFDASLRAQDPGMGIRDSADLDALAEAAGLTRVHSHALPANNHILVWQRRC